jgi:Fe-S-cluster-containing dehydrogenase component
MMKQWYMVIDVAKCHDCNNCFMACKDEHVDNDWEGYTASQPRHGHRWMNIERIERGKYSRNDVRYLPMPCQHCENAPCIKASDGAITRREDGIVMIDMVKAKGNEKLVKACPYGAIYWNDEVATPQKCTFCAHLLDNKDWKPGIPRCVHTCPTGALKTYNVEPEEFEKIVKEEELKAYKEELGTNPHVMYKNLHQFTKNFIAGGITVDGDCFEDATVTIESKGSVLQTAKTNFFGDFKFDGLDDGAYTINVDAAGQKRSVNVTVSGQSHNLGFISF